MGVRLVTVPHRLIQRPTPRWSWGWWRAKTNLSPRPRPRHHCHNAPSPTLLLQKRSGTKGQPGTKGHPGKNAIRPCHYGPHVKTVRHLDPNMRSSAARTQEHTQQNVSMEENHLTA